MSNKVNVIIFLTVNERVRRCFIIIFIIDANIIFDIIISSIVRAGIAILKKRVWYCNTLKTPNPPNHQTLGRKERK